MKKETINLESVTDEAIKRPGRPRKYDEPLAQITVNIPASMKSEILKTGNMTEFVINAIREKLERLK